MEPGTIAGTVIGSIAALVVMILGLICKLCKCEEPDKGTSDSDCKLVMCTPCYCCPKNVHHSSNAVGAQPSAMQNQKYSEPTYLGQYNCRLPPLQYNCRPLPPLGNAKIYAKLSAPEDTGMYNQSSAPRQEGRPEFYVSEPEHPGYSSMYAYLSAPENARMYAQLSAPEDPGKNQLSAPEDPGQVLPPPYPG